MKASCGSSSQASVFPLLVSDNTWDKKFFLKFPEKAGLFLVYFYTEDTAFGMQLSAGVGVFLLLDSTLCPMYTARCKLRLDSLCSTKPASMGHLHDQVPLFTCGLASLYPLLSSQFMDDFKMYILKKSYRFSVCVHACIYILWKCTHLYTDECVLQVKCISIILTQFTEGLVRVSHLSWSQN